MTRHFSRVLDLLTIAFMLFVVTACVPSSAPRYKGDITKEPKNMTPFEQGSVRMKLPPGYDSKPLPPNAEEELKQLFQKTGSSATVMVHCFGGFVGKGGIQVQLLKAVDSAIPIVAMPQPRHVVWWNLGQLIEQLNTRSDSL